MNKVARGIIIKTSSAGAAPVPTGGSNILGTPDLIPIAGASLGAGALGTGLGYGLAKLTAPSVGSVSNLRKEEQYLAYKKAIEEVKARIAEKKQRLQGI